MSYTRIGPYPLVPSADFTDIDSAINVNSAARVGDSGVGKNAGMIAIRATDVNDATTYSMVFATGSDAADVWRVLDGSATYTPA